MSPVFEREISASIKELLGWPWPKIPDAPRYAGQMHGIPVQKPFDFFCLLPAGRTLVLECKQCAKMGSLPLCRIADHQLRALGLATRRGHLAYLLVNFRKDRQLETYAVTAGQVYEFQEAEERKSLPRTWFTKEGIQLERVKLQKGGYGWGLGVLLEEEYPTLGEGLALAEVAAS